MISLWLGRGIMFLKILGALGWALAGPQLWADSLKKDCVAALTATPSIQSVHWSPTGHYALQLKAPIDHKNLQVELLNIQDKSQTPLEVEIPSPYQAFGFVDSSSSPIIRPQVGWSADESYVTLQMLIHDPSRPKKIKEVVLIFDTNKRRLVAVPGFTLAQGHRVNKILFDQDLPNMATVLFRHEQYIDITAQVWNLAFSELMGEWVTNRSERIESFEAHHYEALSPDVVVGSRISVDSLAQGASWLSPDGSYAVRVRADRQALEVVRKIATDKGPKPFKIRLLQELPFDVQPQTELFWLQNGAILIAHNGDRAWYWHREKGQAQTFAADRIVFHGEEMVVFIDRGSHILRRAYHLETMQEL